MDVLGQDRREGLGRKAESRVGLLLLILVSGILLLSSLYSAEASVFRKARETVIDAAAPALKVLSGPIAYVQHVVGDVQDYFHVLKQNQALREENAELRQWMNEALALRKTVESYEQLQHYYAPPEGKPIDAFVIGESNDSFTHSMLVNVGAKGGVERGQAVVDGGGLVGRIVDVGKNASRILLLTDVQSRVPVYIEDAGVEGILVGRTGSRPAVSFVESSDPVNFEPGQRVLTSGAGGVLPRGLPVGVVTAARDGEAIVRLYANYAKTRMVRVINYQFPAVEPVDAGSPEGDRSEEQTPDAGPQTAADASPRPARANAPTPAATTPEADPFADTDEGAPPDDAAPSSVAPPQTAAQPSGAAPQDGPRLAPQGG
ncbi:MAG: rod shape-determining protein MreC [Alphaproteobacteria bacterium]|nr:rod shape-determining protein MreC [Alphaproteobacteria bacterium]